MRRLWAHIVIAFTCIVTAFASFPTVLKSISTNGDFETRRQFTFQLTEREESEDNEVVALNENSAKDMAKIMESRLVTTGVTSYEMQKTGRSRFGGKSELLLDVKFEM